MHEPYILLWDVPGAAHRELENLGATSSGGYWWLHPPLEPDFEHLYQQQAGFAERAAQLSEKLRCTALGVMNLEDTALLLWAYHRGRLVFQYDSNPMYLGCPVCSYSSETVGALVHGLDELCRLRGVPQRQQALRAWLVRRRGLGFMSERERLEKILALLELPTSSAYTPQ
ncbi:MAG: hypothetical protein KatS3mg070_2693 [Meiothermus sp.]|uniref:hypothetical protein n=1 Tax=Meiothermus sp. TaxID=1955249 RepID=UPI0021DC0608|nr:hypothetical protein [Meiothermus sp.]GIW29330.1 MAG: hypothetical protein KatS3mg070_2693 [Meiothermus sp.]